VARVGVSVCWTILLFEFEDRVVRVEVPDAAFLADRLVELLAGVIVIEASSVSETRLITVVFFLVADLFFEGVALGSASDSSEESAAPSKPVYRFFLLAI
jgi:hypothetical protein